MNTELQESIENSFTTKKAILASVFYLCTNAYNWYKD